MQDQSVQLRKVLDRDFLPKVVENSQKYPELFLDEEMLDFYQLDQFVRRTKK